MNILTFDIEEWFHILDHPTTRDEAGWEKFDSRFERNTERILEVLKGLRLIDGMSLEEHHGYEVGHTATIFGPPDFRLVRHRRFQLGLNHLFVFERQTAAGR